MNSIAKLYTNAVMISSSNITLCDPNSVQRWASQGDCLAASNSPVFISKREQFNGGNVALTYTDDINSFEQAVLSRTTGILQKELLHNPVWKNSWRNGYNVFDLIQPSITLFSLSSQSCWIHLSGPLVRLDRIKPNRVHCPVYTSRAPASVYGPHMFLYAVKPSLHPDLLLNRLSFFINWTKRTFGHLEGYNHEKLMRNDRLIAFHKQFRLFRLRGHQNKFENYCDDGKTIGENAVPHYKMLSKERALERVWKVRMQLAQFLERIDRDDARTRLTLFGSFGSLAPEDTLMDLASRVDIMGHMNQLNLKLQGERKYVGEMWQTVKGFGAKLGLFRQGITGAKDHFPTLRTFDECMEHPAMAQEACEKAGSFIADKERDFSKRFHTCKKINDLIDLIVMPGAADRVQWKAQLPEFIARCSRVKALRFLGRQNETST